MMKQIRILDIGGHYTYAPGTIPGVVNTEEISTVRTTYPDRNSGDFVLIKMKNGEEFIAEGRPEHFLDQQ